MKLDVLLALRNPGTEYAFSVEQTMAPQDVNGAEVGFDPVVITGVMVADEDGSVTLDGKLTTVAHAQCANCLAPASSIVEGEFRETNLICKSLNVKFFCAKNLSLLTKKKQLTVI